MAAKPLVEITLSKLRNGAPDALAALCARRGPAVYAYCERVVGAEHAAEVAAAALAQFRLAVISPGALSDTQQAEPLLRHVTRRVALAHLFKTVEGDSISDECRGRSGGLVGYVGDKLSPDERAAVSAHIERCATCAATLRRLKAGEPAFSQSNPPLKPTMAQLMLTAMVSVAPVNVGASDATAVRDEALRIVAGEHEVAAPVPGAPASVEAAPPGPPPWADHDFPDAPEPTASPTEASRAGAAPPPAQPSRAAGAPSVAEIPALPTASFPSAAPGIRHRLRSHVPRQRPYTGVSRTAMLVRGLIRLILVGAVAAGAGILIGIGVSELSGAEPATPTPFTPSTSTPTTSTVAVEQRPVEVVGSTVRSPSGGGVNRAIVDVEVRVENARGQPITMSSPQLLIDDDRFAAAPETAGTSPELSATTLDAGDVATGTLRFDVTPMTPDEVTTARVRLRMLNKTVPLNPELRAPPSAG